MLGDSADVHREVVFAARLTAPDGRALHLYAISPPQTAELQRILRWRLPPGRNHVPMAAAFVLWAAEYIRSSFPGGQLTWAFVFQGLGLIVYHHSTRRAGGHDAQIEHWAGWLRQAGFQWIDALRAKPYSPRAFFLLDAPDDVRCRAEQIEQRWRGLITWHPRSQPPLSGEPNAQVEKV